MAVTPVSTDDLVDLFEQIAEEAPVPVRAIGGIGIRLRSGIVAGCERTYNDLDVAATSRDRGQLEKALERLGLKPEERFNALRGSRRQVWWTPDESTHVDLFLGRFEMCHDIELEKRLAFDHPAMPAADLALMKLQVVALEPKDEADLAALLLTHTLGSDDGEGMINTDRFHEVLRGDWGFYTSVTDNLSRIHERADWFRSAQSAKLRASVEALLDDLTAGPKSRRFAARALVGRRVRWHREPEESLGA